MAARIRSRSSSFSTSYSSPSLPSTPSPARPHGNVAALVPFLWEEKPGISKQPRDSTENHTANPWTNSPKGPELSRLSMDDYEILPLPTPPCLQKPYSFVESKRSDGIRKDRRKADSPSKKRPPGRKWRTEDDPFALAIQACREDSSELRSSIEECARKQSLNLSENLVDQITEDEGCPRKQNSQLSSVARCQSFGVVEAYTGGGMKMTKPRMVGWGREQVVSGSGKLMYGNARAKSERYSTMMKSWNLQGVKAGDEKLELESYHHLARQKASQDQISCRKSSSKHSHNMVGKCMWGCRNAENYHDSIISISGSHRLPTH